MRAQWIEAHRASLGTRSKFSLKTMLCVSPRAVGGRVMQTSRSSRKILTVGRQVGNRVRRAGGERLGASDAGAGNGSRSENVTGHA